MQCQWSGAQQSPAEIILLALCRESRARKHGKLSSLVRHLGPTVLVNALLRIFYEEEAALHRRGCSIIHPAKIELATFSALG